MNVCQSVIPFGLIFEEQAPHPGKSIPLVYDEHSDISYVHCEDGRLIPYVEFKYTDVTVGATQAATEFSHRAVKNPMWPTGTQTETKVQKETTDTDPPDDQTKPRTGFGTQTITAVRAESTDIDSEYDNAGRPLQGLPCSRVVDTGLWLTTPRTLTNTFTEVKTESTDED